MPSFLLHHIGVLVGDIEKASRDYMNNFGYEVRSPIIHDPVQTAFVRFLALPMSTAYLELVAPDGPQSLLQNGLKKAGGLNHLCFSTESLDETLEDLRRNGALTVRQPVPAVAFGNRRIAWVLDPSRALIELLERGDSADDDFPPLVAGGLP